MYSTLDPLTTAFLTLYPPNTKCTNEDCSAPNESKPSEKPDLLKAEFSQVAIYTTSGAQRAWSIHLYCPGKETIIPLRCFD